MRLTPAVSSPIEPRQLAELFALEVTLSPYRSGMRELYMHLNPANDRDEDFSERRDKRSSRAGSLDGLGECIVLRPGLLPRPDPDHRRLLRLRARNCLLGGASLSIRGAGQLVFRWARVAR